MTILITVLSVLVGLVILTLFMIYPGKQESRDFALFRGKVIAHRGLHDNETEVPENSMAAFRKGLQAGLPMEFDVQRTKDDVLVVFHDDDLKRMTGRSGLLSDYTYKEIQTLTLADSGEKIPLFQEVLNLIQGQVPLVIEIKVNFDYKRTTEAVHEMLTFYKGPYCIECFNPLALRWYRKREPQVLTGWLTQDFFHDPAKMPRLLRFFMTHCLLNFLCKPGFVSYRHRDRRKLGFRIYRKLFGGRTACWTIQSQEELDGAENDFDCWIFDSFLPKRG